MLDEGRLAYIGRDQIIFLNDDEFEILKLLLDNKGRVLTMKGIASILYGNIGLDSCVKDSIRQRIHRLRKKLSGEVEILTKRTVGYYVK